MRKKILFLVVALVFVFSVIMTGCAASSEKQTNSSSHETLKLTLNEIKKNYTDAKIKSVRNIGEEYVLVESQQDTFANKFDLYNLKTGDMDTMPTMPEFVSLEKIENENYFVFLSSGKNSESPFGDFPYLIKCIRIKNDISKNDDFAALKDNKYFNLDYSVQAGSKEGVMSNLIVTLDGLEVSFEPIKGKELGFYADAADIPFTKTSFDRDRRQIVFEIGTNVLGEKLSGTNKVMLDDNQYMSSYELIQKDNKIYLAVTVRDLVKSYMVRSQRLPNGLPYFSVKFESERI